MNRVMILSIFRSRLLFSRRFLALALTLLFLGSSISECRAQSFQDQAPRPQIRSVESKPSGDTAITIRKLDPYSFPSIGLHCTVSISGVPAHGLTRRDFSLTEGTREVENFEIAIKGVPIDVALVLDTSGSVRNFVSEIKAGAKVFVDLMKNSDRASVVEFSDSVIQTQALTSDRALLGSAIDEIRATGGTKLYDGILRGLSDLNPGRGVLVVMTDGRDVRRSEDTQRYSDAGSDQVLAEALRRKVPVFAIGVGNDIDVEGLTGIAGKTGGAFFQTLDPKGISEIFEKISKAINCHYMITYGSPAPESRGEWRKVEIRAQKGGASASAEYCVPLPPELAAKTRPIDTIRLYGFFGTGLKISTHDKDHMVAEVHVLGSDERFLSRMTSELTGKTLWMLMRGGGGSSSGGTFRDGKGTGARVFHLISGQKFFIVDDGKSLPVCDLKVPRGCTVEIYGPSCPVEVGDTGGPLTVVKRTGTDPVEAGAVGDLSIVSHGTSHVHVAKASGRVLLLTQGTSNITVDSGEASELFVSVDGTGDVTFGGTAAEAEIFCSGTGDVTIASLSKPPRRRALTGVGTISIGKGQGSMAWDPLDRSSRGDAGFSIPLPDAPPFPGIGPYWGESGDEVLIPDNIGNTDGIPGLPTGSESPLTPDTGSGWSGTGDSDTNDSDADSGGSSGDDSDSDGSDDSSPGFEMPDLPTPDIDIPDAGDFSGDED